MAVGFDLIAAECALSLRDELKGLKVVAVIPFEGMQKSFKQPQRELFERIAEQADESVIIASHYSKSVYMMRNNYLVDNSSATIAYFTGRRSGTSYTIRRAEKSLSYIINIYDNPQQELFK